MSTKDQKQIAVTFTAEQHADIMARCAAQTPDTDSAVMKPTQYIMMLYLQDVARRPLKKGRFT